MTDRTEKSTGNGFILSGKPFTDHALRSLFCFLCKKWLGDTFSIIFQSREEWTKANAAYDGSAIFVPYDVTRSEMADILDSAGRKKDEIVKDPRASLPANALVHFLFRKGKKRLANEMPFDSMPRYAKNCMLDWKRGQKTLREALRIDALSDEYEEAKRTGDVSVMADKEFEIADKLQGAIRNFPFKLHMQQPTDMIEQQKINCQGGSFLGIALLSEVLSGTGIRYLLGDIPKHSILVLVTSDGTVEWHDMIAPWLNEEITDAKIYGATMKEILAYAKDPSPEGLMFDIKNDRFETPRALKEGQRHFLTLFPPDLGVQMQILYCLAYVLIDLGFKEKNVTKKEEYFIQALLACELSAAYEPKYEYVYNKMGECLLLLLRHKEAVSAFTRARDINPQNPFSYYGLGKSYSALGMTEEAIHAYRQYLLLADEDAEVNFIMDAVEKIRKLSEE